MSRWAVALLLATAMASTLAPAILSGHRRVVLLDYGSVSLVLLLWLVPVWTLPWAIFGRSTVTLENDVLTAETFRGRKTVALSRVDRIWARRIPATTGMLVLAGIGGEDQPQVWFLWGGSGTVAYGDAMTQLLRQLAESPGVRISQRAAIILGLDGHAKGWARLGLWLRGLLLYTAVVAVPGAALLGYLMALG